MIITCLGHAKFLLELENGMHICTDPFDASTGYPIADRTVDAVLVSHGHHDHSAVETLKVTGPIVDTAGPHTLAPDVKVTAIPCYHDDAEGQKRGKNLMFVLEAEGLRVAHLGDLGHLPNDEQKAALGHIDVMMIPVGGFFTIDAQQAKQVCDMIAPRVILPMHYRSQYNAGWPIAPVEDFLSLMSEKAEHIDLLRVTKGDMACQPRIAVLNAQA